VPIRPGLFIDVNDEGALQGRVNTIDFVGGGVSAAVSGVTATVTITGGSGSPGGSDTQVQFNDAASFGGDAGLTYNKTSDTLTIAGGLVVDTSTLVVDATNNRVGIGTAAPDFQIHSLFDGTNITALDSYGQASPVRLRSGNGTSAAITRKASGESLGSVQWWGAAKDDAAAGATFITGSSTIRAVTRETFTSTGRGTQLEFQTAAIGGTSVATALTVASDAVTLSAGVTLTFPSNGLISGSDNQFWSPRASRTSRYTLKTGNVVAGGPDVYGNFWGGTEQNQLFFDIHAQTDTSGTPSNYYNALTDFGARDASGNTGTAFSLLSEGNWTNAGGFTLNRMALWNYGIGGVGKTVWFTQSGSSMPVFERQVFTVGGDSPSGTDGFALRVYGFDVANDDAPTGTAVGIDANNYFRSNTTTVREWQLAELTATLNFGGSNTNKTVNILKLSTVNTATTGATVNLIDALYGATQVFRLTSAANAKLGGTASRGTTEGTNQFVMFDGTAPVGTLTNGCTIYSASGELLVMDSAGNATLLS
jgi:hypothetical protein